MKEHMKQVKSGEIEQIPADPHCEESIKVDFRMSFSERKMTIKQTLECVAVIRKICILFRIERHCSNARPFKYSTDAVRTACLRMPTSPTNPRRVL